MYTYSHLDDMLPKECTKKHSFFIQMAARVATKSNMSHRHGCLIVADNKIVCAGYNRHAKLNHAFSIHAEIDALQKAKNALQEAKHCVMYVVRISPSSFGGSHCLKYSKPCQMCSQYIQKSRISKVFYSTNWDFEQVVCHHPH